MIVAGLANIVVGLAKLAAGIISGSLMTPRVSRMVPPARCGSAGRGARSNTRPKQ